MSEEELSRLQEFSKLNSLRECPVCGGELQKGYIHTTRDIYWDEERHKHNILACREVIIMAQWPYLFRTIPHAPSLKCTNCKIVVFHYGKR